MALHVVVGAGPVGSAVARELLGQGESVRVVTRTGSGPEGAECVAADASDAAALTRLSVGAAVIYNCVNPPYDKWTQLWPPLAASFLGAAESSGAVLAIVDNLYPFGPVDGPMTNDTPDRPSSVKGRVRADMWREALEVATSGRIKAAVAVRGSDYIGDGPSALSELIIPRMRAGKAAWVPADLDALHTWTNPGDAGRLLVRAAADPRGWNRFWLVPSAEPKSFRQLVTRLAEIDGRPAPTLHVMPRWVLRVAGLFKSQIGELVEMNYQFRRPFVLDTTATEAVFGDAHTPLDESLRQNLRVTGSFQKAR